MAVHIQRGYAVPSKFRDPDPTALQESEFWHQNLCIYTITQYYSDAFQTSCKENDLAKLPLSPLLVFMSLSSAPLIFSTPPRFVFSSINQYNLFCHTIIVGKCNEKRNAVRGGAEKRWRITEKDYHCKR